MRYMLFILALLSLISCASNEDYGANTDLIVHVRAKVLENNTITYCILDMNEKEIYKRNDTVWLDLATHRINDTADHTMQAVLLQKGN